MMFRRSDVLILSAAFFSFLLSVYLWFTDQKEAGVYVGLWVPSIIAAGTYVKLLARARGDE